MMMEEKNPYSPQTRPKKKRRGPNKRLRRIVTLLIVVLTIAAIAVTVWYFLFRKKGKKGDIMTETAMLSNITSTVEGSGNARAGATSAITVETPGTIQDVFVETGDQVMQGQPLYTIYSPTAEEEAAKAEKACADQRTLITQLEKGVTDAQRGLEEAEKNLSRAQKDLTLIRGKASELTVTAPFAGKLLDVADLKVGQELKAGTQIATLVNDRHMTLTLYFSYAYESQIFVGQKAEVSVPALMLTTEGKVEEIHKVSYISQEGGTFFEVVVGLENPDALTEGMEASAVMKASSGEDIYPYESGELRYSETAAITVTQDGAVEQIGSLRNYTNVQAGQTLLVQSREALDRQIEDAQNAMDAAVETVNAAAEAIPAAEEAVTQAQAHLEELNQALEKAKAQVGNVEVTAPISGSVTSCVLTPGLEVAGGTTVVTISDTTNMVVEITVDDRNIPFVTPGMSVELSDYNGSTYIGTVTNIDMSASDMGSMGLTNYPVTLSVENYEGTLLQGMWLDYSFATSESQNCVTVPIQCVKSIVDKDGEPQTVVFLQAEQRPENAVDFEIPDSDGSTPAYPSPKEGYWPVPVETGLSDRYNVEIVSGLSEGETVFSAYMMTEAYSY